MALAIALCSGLSACGASRGWMPAIVLGAKLTRVSAVQVSAAVDAARPDRGSWSAGADLSVAWLPAPRESTSVAHRSHLPPMPSSALCASSALCTWEQEICTQTLIEAVAEERTP